MSRPRYAVLALDILLSPLYADAGMSNHVSITCFYAPFSNHPSHSSSPAHRGGTHDALCSFVSCIIPRSSDYLFATLPAAARRHVKPPPEPLS
ncbi:hypothetical protein FB451DRAFT_1300475 [Mycena latifolia]|nr:hypothetical protein FB451DRAFT_1300475 [Mycena latifolia]